MFFVSQACGGADAVQRAVTHYEIVQDRIAGFEPVPVHKQLLSNEDTMVKEIMSKKAWICSNMTCRDCSRRSPNTGSDWGFTIAI